MKKTFYKNWDWELDHGVNEFCAGDVTPASYVIAYSDFWGRLYRVHRYEEAALVDSYDYFCDESGRILEKRGIYQGVDGHVCVIVKYAYDMGRNTVTETAWWPDSDELPKIVVRKLE